MALQLRFLQTLAEMSDNKSSTIVFPLPLELLKPFFEKGLHNAIQNKPDSPENSTWSGKGNE
jgi:hypothetical protein